VLVSHEAVDESVQREIATDAHVASRADRLTDLPHQDAAGADTLTAEYLDAAKLRVGSASVPSRAAALFVCHVVSCFLALALDAGDLDRREILAMALLFVMLLAPAELEHDELSRSALGHDLPFDLGASDERFADLGRISSQQEHLIELDLGARITRELIHSNRVALGHAVLLSAAADDCAEHWGRER